jgi:glycerophosphoryl diester phosphodiesterase
MSIQAVFAALFFFTISASAAEIPSFVEAVNSRPRNVPMIIAHRGCWETGAPENSLNALKVCMALRVDMMEADVRATEDGVLVLLHDETLERTTTSSGKLDSVRYAQLESTRLREGSGGPAAQATQEVIPKLSEVLKLAIGHVYLLLHVKEGHYKEISETAKSEGALPWVAFLIDDPADCKELQSAAVLRESNVIPVIWECSGLDSHRNCYKTLRAGVSGYQYLRPIAYFPISKGDRFLRNSAILGLPSRLIWSPDEGQNLADLVSTWSQLRFLQADFILTDHPAELVTFLAQKGARREGHPR